MSEEAELLIELWERMSEYVNDNDKLGAAHQMLQSFHDHGHAHACEEIANNASDDSSPLAQAALEWI